MASWTTPITWVHGSVYLASDFNAQLRDNLTVLKTAIGADGRFLGLSAAYLANLSGANLTGVGILGAANTWSARFDASAGRIVVPVEGAYGGTDDGDLSVVGQYLYWRDNAGNKWKYLGMDTGVAPAGAVAGSVWVEADNNVHYIDSVGEERYIVGTTASMHSDAAARAGSMWMENFLQWITLGGAQEYQGHGDFHSDAAHSDTHSDVAHADSHSDSHTDSHTDVAHGDVAHTDTHTDFHVDSAGGHGDSHGDTHSDVAHTDTAHTDSHSDVAHSDSHTDTHTDTHSDTAHADSHTDQPVAG